MWWSNCRQSRNFSTVCPQVKSTKKAPSKFYRIVFLPHQKKKMSSKVDILIIGGGFSGICAGIQLLKHGITNFQIVEMGSALGGTWRDNHYPGAACDVRSHLYCFSFEPNPNWSRVYSGQSEIWDYMERCVDKYNLRPYIQLNCTVKGMTWKEEECSWNVACLLTQTTSTTTTQQSGDGTSKEKPLSSTINIKANYVVNGAGVFSRISVPKFKGMNRFQGESFHSARWNHDVDFKGKRVAVVGTGASAIQFLPPVAQDAGTVFVFQRSASWVLPRRDRDYSKTEQWVFANVPLALRLVRSSIYLMNELLGTFFVKYPAVLKLAERLVTERAIKKQVRDPIKQALLTPTYRLGCKRILLSNEWYPTMDRDNVHIVTTGIREVTETGIVTEDGTSYDVDVIIFGTGFLITDVSGLPPVLGRNGVNLAEMWERESTQAYYGLCIHHFPNLFVLIGPNTGLGHTSIVFMIECQVQYMIQLLKIMAKEKKRIVEVKKEVQEEHNAELQEKSKSTIWLTGCASWYLKDGRNSTLWPFHTVAYWWRLLSVDRRDYVMS